MPKEWIGAYVEVWLDPRSAERGNIQHANPEGILKRAWPGMIEIENEHGTTMVLMAHVVTIWKAKETA